MKLSEKQQIFALNFAKLVIYIYEKGFACTYGEAFRTDEQAEIYAKSGKGIKNSLHCSRLAIDLNLFSAPGGDYLSATEDHKQFGEYWESLNPKNRWGGRFNDGNHYEMQK